MSAACTLKNQTHVSSLYPEKSDTCQQPVP
jgi:hypothetical protein